MEPRDIAFAEIEVGDRAEFEWSFSREQVLEFGAIVGDHNPIHRDPAFVAAHAPFEGPVVQGALVAGLVSQIVGAWIPGRYSLLLGYSIDFRAPAYPGDRLLVHAEVDRKVQGTRNVRMTFEILDGSGRRRLASGRISAQALR